MKRLHIVILMALLLGVGLFLNSGELLQPNKAVQRSTSPQQIPDYYFSNFALKRFDENGRLTLQIAGDYIQQIPDTDASKADNTELVYHSKTGEDWTMTGTTLEYQQQAHILVLKDGVTLSNGTIHISSNDLVWDGNNETVSTAAEILLQSEHWRHLGVGMTLFLDRNLVDLHSSIRGRYEPRPQ